MNPKQSRLTAERVRELFHYDPETGVVTRRQRQSRNTKAGEVVGCATKGYLYANADKESHLVHRLAWLHYYGAWPLGDIDHINHDTQDNRIANLRDVSKYANLQNMRRSKTNSVTGVLGVSLAPHHKSKPFRAVITTNGKLKHIGYFDNPESAFDAYLAAKRELHQGNTL